MNLNQKIDPIRGDGIPGYNRKINEIIAALNWLMGMRVINGRPISESDQGPVFDLSQANMTQGKGALDATDPNGNPAGWSKIKVFDPTGLVFYDVYAWTGALLSQEDAPWLFDPASKQAGWIVCTDNTFWGTGKCPGQGSTCTNYQNGVPNGTQSGNSWTLPFNPSSPPIVPPASCTPRFYFVPTAPSPAPSPNQPALIVLANGGAIGWEGITFDWTVSMTYDGTPIWNASGSSVTTTPGGASGSSANLLLSPAGWVFDPSGLPGYSQGNGYWVYEFNGAASTNTNPTVVINFNWSNPSNPGLNLSPVDWNVVFMTG